jgi:DNA-binding XRE family transcriptional regulator
MKESKRKKLEAAGWAVETVSEFLGLSEEEEMLVEMKLSLATSVKARRRQLRLTQQELAKRIGSSQSRVAKMEIPDRSVSLELLIRSLASLGASQAEIGRIVGQRVDRGKPTKEHKRRKQPASK